MIKENYASKIQQVEKRMKQWEKRSLSPIGKITVIKTLLLPIFNNLLLSLPNPNNAVLNSINEIFYNFLWNKKAKIKKSVVVKQYCEGGLQMINILGQKRNTAMYDFLFTLPVIHFFEKACSD